MGQFSNPQEFINSIVAGAKKGYELYGVFASVTIAQALGEAGWDMSQPSAYQDNNLFGIKWSGAKDPTLNITVGTLPTDGDRQGAYRHYESISDSVQDHGYFLKNNSRYTDAGVFSATTPEEQIIGLKKAGYAEDENYIQSITDLLDSYKLKQYDTGTFNGGDSANSKSDAITIEATNYQVVKDSERKGNALFGRKYRITVSDDSGDALDVSDLRCTFNIIKTIQMEPNSSEITIYNLNAKTENTIMMNGKRVTVEAGYEGSQFGLIFDGDILQTIRERENGTTLKLTIIALDSDRAINFDIANFSLVKGQTARDIVEHVTSQATKPISMGSISEKLSGQKLTRGKVVFGKASDVIRQIAKSNELQYYMDDGRLNLISLDELPEGEIIELTPTSGLIGTPEQTDYGVAGQCLLNPQIKLNSLIHIDNSTVRAKQIDINGSNTAPQGGTVADSSTGLSSTRNAIIAEAKNICNDPNTGYSQSYRYAGYSDGWNTGSKSGKIYYDCSSFTEHCYKVAGLFLNSTSQMQWQQIKTIGMTIVDNSIALAGDLVFWFDGNGECDHVAIYAGNNDIYAASTDSKPFADQVLYEPIYGDYKIGRIKEMIKADGGEFPSANNATSSTDSSQSLFRSLDRDGIYRVIKTVTEGDTRGEAWTISFETVDQIGGLLAAVSN